MDLQKSKLIVIIPIVVSILAASFGSIKYIINLTETIEKNSIPFVFVFTAKIYIAMLYLIPINMKKHHSSFKSPVILSIFSSGAGPRDIQVVVPGEICV